MAKVKKAGMEFNYRDSFMFEWYVKFEDNTEFYMFQDDGDDTLYADMLAYAQTSNVAEIGIKPFSQSKADAINNYQDHQFTAISSQSIEELIWEAPEGNEGNAPYIMRRKQFVDNKVEVFFVLSFDMHGNEFYIIRSDGTSKEGDNKFLQWSEI